MSDHDLDRFLLDFANQHMIEAPGKTPGEIANDPALRDDLEAEFGSRLPAGYTYFGQFVDHDVTFDTASSLVRRNDPHGILNFRTPRLDLDNVYGRGRDDQPYLYDMDDRDKFLIGKVKGTELRDLPRNSTEHPEARALIGDMRNDENSIVCQLQLAFLLAHNRLVERARRAGIGDAFEAARQTLRWLYQWIVWNDFLARVTTDSVWNTALQLVETGDGRKRWVSGLSDVFDWKHQPFMPVEFSVAAYRFGHSLVRNSYQTNNPHRGFGNFAPIFDNTGATNPDDLRGFRPLLKENYVQWDWFLDMDSQGPFPQRARKIDTKLANALAFLHEGGGAMNVLAFRNLRRGLSFDLPSGTDVARKWCLTPLQLCQNEIDALWFYILREAEGLEGDKAGQHLGTLGSVIVCSVFGGLLLGDPNSFHNQAPCWTPDDDALLISGEDNRDSDDGAWELSSIIRLSGLPVNGSDVEQQTNGS